MKGFILTTPKNISTLHTSLFVKNSHSFGVQLRLVLCQNKNISLSECPTLCLFFLTTIMICLPIQPSVAWCVFMNHGMWFPTALALVYFHCPPYFLYETDGWKDECITICFLKGKVHKRKFCHYLLAVMLFQTHKVFVKNYSGCYSYYLCTIFKVFWNHTGAIAISDFSLHGYRGQTNSREPYFAISIEILKKIKK